VLKDYIDLFSDMYKNELFNLVDENADFYYFSRKLRKLLDVKNINEVKLLPGINLDRTHKINKYIMNSGKQRVLFTTGLINNESHAFKITKSPIFHPESDRVIGVFTLIRNSKIINWDDSGYPKLEELCFKLDSSCKFSVIDELILFYASIGYTQGEIYSLITKQGRKNLSLNGFKYYYNCLLEKTGTSSINEIIINNNLLKSRRFIPNHLIKVPGLVI